MDSFSHPPPRRPRPQPELEYAVHLLRLNGSQDRLLTYYDQDDNLRFPLIFETEAEARAWIARALVPAAVEWLEIVPLMRGTFKALRETALRNRQSLRGLNHLANHLAWKGSADRG